MIKNVLNFVCLFLKRWFQLNSRKVRTQFASIMDMNNWEMIANCEVTISDDVLAAVDFVFA